jgi:hypothetical protein
VGLWDELKSIAKDFHEEIIKPGAEIYNLLQMSESSGMAHLRVRVPQLIQDGMFDDFIEMLQQMSWNQDAPDDYRQKARTYAPYAEALAREFYDSQEEEEEL